MGNPIIKTDRQSVESLITWQCSKDTPDVSATLLALLVEKEAAERDTRLEKANTEIFKARLRNCEAALVERNAQLLSKIDALRLAEAARDASQAALERISGMAERPVCICGVPTGTAAIKACADKAIAARKETGK